MAQNDTEPNPASPSNSTQVPTIPVFPSSITRAIVPYNRERADSTSTYAYCTECYKPYELSVSEVPALRGWVTCRSHDRVTDLRKTR